MFICTIDPYKEPPIRLVSTALSVMAYDYPTEKISVYVLDDGVSQLTLFACMEAAKFTSHWLPFCRKRNMIDRSLEAYFASIRGNWRFEAMGSLVAAVQEKEGRRKKKIVLTLFDWIVKLDKCQNFR